MSLSRRQLLKALGASPALPLLPSLLSRAARGQAAAMPKFYVHFCTDHGAVWTSNMFPASAPAATQTYAGRTIRRQPLAVAVNGGTASLSPTLSGPSSALTARLASKMNVIQGLDWPFYLGHHSGGHLGNTARNDGNGGDGTLLQAHPRVTIDQLMAWSPSFYGDLTGVRERAMVMGSRVSYNYANPASRTGAIQEVTGTSNSNTWFDRIFPPGTSVGGPAPRAPVISRVSQAYQRAHDSARRLSAEDKVRLEQHLQRLAELDRRLSVAAPVTCTQPQRPAQSNAQRYGGPYVGDYDVAPEKNAGYHAMLNDLITAAFTCRLSRIAVIKSNANFSPYSGDWHQDIAHKADQAAGAAQGLLAAGNQRFFSGVVLDLAAKLDAVSDGQGGTLLDHSLLVWTQESGNLTHNSFSVPVITFGGAGGYFSTGNYVDYRNLSRELYAGSTEKEYAGLFMHQWLGMTLRAMGVPRSEWAEPDHGGYSRRYSALNWASVSTQQAYPDAMWATTGEDLPFLRA